MTEFGLMCMSVIYQANSLFSWDSFVCFDTIVSVIFFFSSTFMLDKTELGLFLTSCSLDQTAMYLAAADRQIIHNRADDLVSFNFSRASR